MRFKNFIWDFDGTLCDSYPHTAEIFQMLMREYNISGADNYEDILLRLQITWIEAIRYYHLPEEAVAKLHQLEADFTLGAHTPKLFPGARATLQKIHANGGRNFLYTLRNYPAANFLAAQGITHYFDEIVLRENGFPSKPAPDAILYLMDKYHLDPNETVMIGDRDLDGMSGINAGCSGCLLTFLNKNVHGEDPLTVTAMPYTCRSFAEFDAMMEIPDHTGYTCSIQK